MNGDRAVGSANFDDRAVEQKFINFKGLAITLLKNNKKINLQPRDFEILPNKMVRAYYVSLAWMITANLAQSQEMDRWDITLDKLYYNPSQSTPMLATDFAQFSSAVAI